MVRLTATSKIIVDAVADMPSTTVNCNDRDDGPPPPFDIEDSAAIVKDIKGDDGIATMLLPMIPVITTTSSESETELCPSPATSSPVFRLKPRGTNLEFLTADNSDNGSPVGWTSDPKGTTSSMAIPTAPINYQNCRKRRALTATESMNEEYNNNDLFMAFGGRVKSGGASIASHSSLAHYFQSISLRGSTPTSLSTLRPRSVISSSLDLVRCCSMDNKVPAPNATHPKILYHQSDSTRRPPETTSLDCISMMQSALDMSFLSDPVSHGSVVAEEDNLIAAHQYQDVTFLPSSPNRVGHHASSVHIDVGTGSPDAYDSMNSSCQVKETPRPMEQLLLVPSTVTVQHDDDESMSDNSETGDAADDDDDDDCFVLVPPSFLRTKQDWMVQVQPLFVGPEGRFTRNHAMKN